MFRLKWRKDAVEWDWRCRAWLDLLDQSQCSSFVMAAGHEVLGRSVMVVRTWLKILFTSKWAG